MNKIVDARGLTCPQPVILTRKAMQEEGGESLTAIVDNSAARENVCRLAQSQGYAVEVEEKEGIYHLHLNKCGEEEAGSCCAGEETVVLVKSRLFGSGQEELGEILMKSFLYSLTESPGKVSSLMFMNSGVFLTAEGSPVLDTVRALEEKGVEVLSCGTCLDYYGLKEKLAVGRVTNMYTVLENLTGAGKTLIL